MPNVSELTRIAHESLETHRGLATNLNISKASREYHLRRARALERELGEEPAELVKADHSGESAKLDAMARAGEVLPEQSTAQVLTLLQLRTASAVLRQETSLGEVGLILFALRQLGTPVALGLLAKLGQ